MISVTDMPVTPKEGERFEGPGNAATCTELAALFAVVGTPSWGTLHAVVRHPAWRAYLDRIPGRCAGVQLWGGESGTPSVWGTLHAVVRHPAWRAYLDRIPGRCARVRGLRVNR